MRIFITRSGGLAALLTALLLSACSPLQLKSLTAEDAGKIRAVNVHYIVPQESFSFAATNPNVSVALGGGLIPALIDASVQASRQQAMQGDMARVFEQLYEFDFRAEAAAVLKEPSTALPFTVSAAQVATLAQLKGEQEASILATKDGTAFVRMWVYYSLDSSLAQYSVRTSAVLWQDGRPQESYKNSLIYQSRVPGDSRDARLAALAAGNRQWLRDETRRAVGQTWRMLAMDLAQRSSSGTAPSSPATKDTVSVSLGGTPVKIGGMRVVDEPDRLIWRGETGALFSLSK